APTPPPASRRLFPSTTLFRSTVDPATGEPLATHTLLDADAVRAALARAADAFERHRATAFEERAEKLRRVADALERDARAHGERSEEHTSELQSRENLVCRLL